MATRRNGKRPGRPKIVAFGVLRLEDLTDPWAERDAALPNPVRPGRGNNAGDKAWLEEMRAGGKIRDLDPRAIPAHCLDDTRIMYTGSAPLIDMLSFEFYRRGDRECSGTAYIRDENGRYVVDEEWTRIRRPCLAAPNRGMNVCNRHGGMIPAVREAAARRLAMEAEKAAEVLVEMTHTSDSTNMPIEPSVRLRAAAQVLDRAGITPGAVYETGTPGYERIMSRMFGADESEES